MTWPVRWSESQKAEIVRHFDLGLSASESAEILGLPSRLIVAGVRRRLGLISDRQMSMRRWWRKRQAQDPGVSAGESTAQGARAEPAASAPPQNLQPGE